MKKYVGAPVGLDPKPYVYEGDWVPRSLLLLKFPSMQAIDRLLQSDEYAPLADLRLACTAGCVPRPGAAGHP